MNQRRIAVTGTDTGIGKTTLTRGLLRALANKGESVRPLKWIETGCEPDASGTLVGLDGQALAAAAKRQHEQSRIGPIRFRLPAAPTVAAEADGVELDERWLRRVVQDAADGVDTLVIEGAGGALVPVTNDLLFVDACRELADCRDFVLVTRDGLGTIHHTLATFEAIEHRGGHVVGVVVNQRNTREANDGSRSMEQMRRWLGDERVLGPIGTMEPDASDDVLARVVESTGLVERVLRVPLVTRS